MVEPLENDEPLLLLDPAELAAVDFLPGFSEEYGDGMEEELEWLSNKEAFPAIESSFEVCVGSAAPPRVPARPRSTRPRRRRRVLSVFQQEVVVERRRCGHCEAEETPQWRAGPEGPKTLCNACGVRYKSGRLLPEYRPATSPTFSPTLHSNSHRRVLQMRRRVSSRHQL